jgi:hypothetical protein
MLKECVRQDVTPELECEGELTYRVTAGGCPSYICGAHRDELEERLEAIARRYPEVNHPEYCGCYGCSEGSW